MIMDSSKVKLHYAIAEAIHQWSEVENSLAFVFAIGLDANLAHNIGTSFAAFWRLQSFRSKLEVVNSVINTTDISDSLRDEWNSLHNRLSRKNKARNELAHFKIEHWSNNEPVLVPYSTESKSIADAVAFQNNTGKDHREMNGRKALYAHDVWQRSESFISLHKDLSAFCPKLNVERHVKRQGVTTVLKEGSVRTAPPAGMKSSRTKK